MFTTKKLRFLADFLAILRYFQNSAKNLIFDQKRFSTSQFLDFSINFSLRFSLCFPIGYYKSCIRKFKLFFFTIQGQNTVLWFFRKKTDDCKFNLLAQKKSWIIFHIFQHIFLRRIESYIYFLNSFTYFFNKKWHFYMEKLNFHDFLDYLRIL